MEIETIIIFFLAVFAAVLAAIDVRMYICIKDFEVITEEQNDHIDTLQSSNNRLTVENAKVTAQISEMQKNDEKFRDIIDTLERLKPRYYIAGADMAHIEPEPEVLPPVSGKDIPDITWTFDRLPEGLTNTYRCEDWHYFDDPASEQWKLQQVCLTDMETGIRFYEKDGKQYMCAALATAYGITIGSGFEITLENGEVFNIIHADYKHDITEARADDFGDHDKNYKGEKTTSVIEFVYDEKVAPDIVNQRGGMFIDRFGGLYGIGGNIVKIIYEGRVWEP